MIFLPKFDTDTMIEWLPKATSMMGVPTFYTRLLGDPASPRPDRAYAAVRVRLRAACWPKPMCSSKSAPATASSNATA
jgi:hypothetical protein